MKQPNRPQSTIENPIYQNKDQPKPSHLDPKRVRSISFIPNEASFKPQNPKEKTHTMTQNTELKPDSNTIAGLISPSVNRPIIEYQSKDLLALKQKARSSNHTSTRTTPNQLRRSKDPPMPTYGIQQVFRLKERLF